VRQYSSNIVLSNVTLGIMRCDYIAEGVIKATKELALNIPLVVRLKGTKEAEAKQYALQTALFWKIMLTASFPRMIKESGLKIIAFDGLDDAAERAVQLANA
jgi:succinyl-CoA synthetase beta subunit